MKACVYCGVDAQTSDHVPPKVCFGLPYPKNLITVPACERCNNRFSKEDEEFASFLSLRVGIDEPATLRLHQKNKKIVGKNHRIRRTILQKTKKVWVKAGEIVLGQSDAIHWSGPGHDAMIARIVRGLYFRVFKQVLPTSTSVSGSFQRPFLGELLANWNSWSGENVGVEGEFRYRYAYDLDEPKNSLWMIIFYDRHFASAKTGSMTEKEEAPE